MQSVEESLRAAIFIGRGQQQQQQEEERIYEANFFRLYDALFISDPTGVLLVCVLSESSGGNLYA